MKKKMLNQLRRLAPRSDGFLCAIILGLLIAPVHAATVSFSPSMPSVGLNDTFNLDLIGTGFDSGTLDGGGINFTYDANVVNVLVVTVNSTDWEFLPDSGTINNTTGTVNGIVFNSLQTRTGNLTFATVQFRAVGLGDSLLGLSEYGSNPFASGGNGYPGLSFNQTGSIAVVPLPATLWLLSTGLALLGVKARSRSPC